LKFPNFFCIGVQKAGTTLLYELLKEIDDIYLPSKKELHFFDTQEYNKGWEWYAHYFQDASDKKSIGEITPSYILINDVAEKISNSPMQGLKFIVILRNPMERAYSHYVMRYRKGEEEYSFEESFQLEKDRIEESTEAYRKYSYFKRGFYSTQIEEYFKYFNEKQFYFILFEDFVKNQDHYIGEVCHFLGVKKNITIKPKKIHSSYLTFQDKLQFSKLNKRYFWQLLAKGYPDMKNTFKEELREYYRDDIKKLEQLINKDLSIWLQ